MLGPVCFGLPAEKLNFCPEIRGKPLPESLVFDQNVRFWGATRRPRGSEGISF